MTDLQQTLEATGQRARVAAYALAATSTTVKNHALRAMAEALRRHEADIIEANRRDVERATANELAPAMIDRLRLDAARIAGMATGIENVAGLTDPTGGIISDWTRPNGIRISKVRVPIGVVGIIYESRPNVTSDAAVLCTKTGNATILRGGSESIESNIAIAAALREGGASEGLHEDAIQLISTTDREVVTLMAGLDKYIDVIVPRGGHSLIEAVVAAARMPVIKHYNGVCMAYIDAAADLDMALKIAVNAKTQRPGVCNAIETILVHREVAATFYPRLADAFAQAGVEIRGDKAVQRLLGDRAIAATAEDWTTEFLDLRIAAGVVDSLSAAIAHINLHSSHHSDCIVTADTEAAERFLNEVDSATVYWNASTRFTDGAEFGFGAEIGISTDKLHARGPMALEELTTYKYKIRGNGQIKT